MKKLLPFFILLLGVAVLVGVFIFIKSKRTQTGESEEKTPEVSFAQRPLTSLTPSEDGHWLTLKIEKIKIDVKSLDYELLYQLPDGRIQGVPGTVDLSKESSVERDLLLGSESSGKFRYDEGVKEGTLTLRFRNEKGKLTAKFTTPFTLLSETKELASVDGKFKLTLDKSSDAFFVVMETFGAPEGYPDGITQGPFGVFSVVEKGISGTLDLGTGNVHTFFGGDWNKLDAGKSQNLGIFVAIP